jgi:hypothetical protein
MLGTSEGDSDSAEGFVDGADELGLIDGSEEGVTEGVEVGCSEGLLDG